MSAGIIYALLSGFLAFLIWFFVATGRNDRTPNVTDKDRIDEEEFADWWSKNGVNVMVEAEPAPLHRYRQTIARIAWMAALAASRQREIKPKGD